MNLVRANWVIVMSALICIALVVLLVRVSSERQLTPLEATLLQIVILSTGVLASYLFSQRSARTAAERLMKPHARSAFRRVKSLYSGLFYLKRVIDQHKGRDADAASQVVTVIEAVVDQQVNTVADAMEDWRDLVPQDVEELEQQLIEHQRVETEDLRR